jgi:carbonic anhydrase
MNDLGMHVDSRASLQPAYEAALQRLVQPPVLRP